MQNLMRDGWDRANGGGLVASGFPEADSRERLQRVKTGRWIAAVIQMVAVIKRKIRLILADDHPVVRDGLAARVNQQADL